MLLLLFPFIDIYWLETYPVFPLYLTLYQLVFDLSNISIVLPFGIVVSILLDVDVPCLKLRFAVVTPFSEVIDVLLSALLLLSTLLLLLLSALVLLSTLLLLLSALVLLSALLLLLSALVLLIVTPSGIRHV